MDENGILIRKFFYFVETFTFIGSMSLQQGFRSNWSYVLYNVMGFIQGDDMIKMNSSFENMRKAACDIFESAINMDMHDIRCLYSLKQFR